MMPPYGEMSPAISNGRITAKWTTFIVVWATCTVLVLVPFRMQLAWRVAIVSHYAALLVVLETYALQ